jgi:peptide/nickel transport system substrate-binding protein
VCSSDLGFPIYSPQPPNTPRSIGGNVTNPYPYSLTAAKALLISHGWTMQSGVMTCTSPGTGANQCGANITLGYTLNLKMVWTSGSATLDAIFNKEIADWASIGVVVTHTTDTTNNVISDCGGGAGYEICSWGNGWNYSPAYYPSGERLFTPAGDFNVGSYVDPKMTSLIDGTIHGGTPLLSYATYAAQQLPVLFQPLQANAVEIVKTLKSSVGFTPNPLGNFMPEYLHF